MRLEILTYRFELEVMKGDFYTDYNVCMVMTWAVDLEHIGKRDVDIPHRTRPDVANKLRSNSAKK